MYSRTNVRCFLLVVVCLLAHQASSDTTHYILDPVESGAQLQSSVSSPTEYFGFEFGSRAIRHHEVMAYFRYLSANSDRAEFAEYGLTLEGRQLFRLVISEPEHLDNLEEINDRLARISTSDGDRSELIESSPAVAWMGYGIHGDELASSDAAVMLAYRLIAGEDDEIRKIRQNLIVYVDPMHNPDGRARANGHVDIFKRWMSANDPQDIVHNQRWPDGRGNHYFFDLNRDAVYQVQRQSQQRIRAILDANPQLYVASHEMGWDNTYLFAVPAKPLNPFLPGQVHESWADFSRDHSAAFDERGISYYTRSWNEVFYPGYYDILPAYLGAVPILYEQAATSGLSVEIPTGQIRTFNLAVSNHFRSSMANLVTASQNKNTLLTRWRQARQDARDNKSTARSWVVLPDNSYKARETQRILVSLGIEVERLDEPIKVRGLHSHWNSAPTERELPSGTLKIDLEQSMAPLIQNILNYHVPMSADFVADEKHNLDLGHETQIYDVTAWSLPLAFNAPIYWSESRLRGQWSEVDREDVSSDKPGLQTPANYGYIYTDDSLHATARLLNQGVRVRAGNEPFVHEGVSYDAGTFLVRNEEQGVDALEFLNAEFAASEIDLIPAQSARITEGGPDLGGDDFSLLEQPKIAILGGSGISRTSFGAVWHLFDEAIGVPVTLLNIENLNSFDLSKYSVLIFPETNDAQDGPLLRKIEAGALRRWIESGGTVITMGKSSMLFANSDIISIKTRRNVLDTYPPAMIGRSASQLISDDFLGLSRATARQSVVLPPVVSAPAMNFVSDGFESFEVEGNVRTFAEWSADLDWSDKDKLKLASGLTKYLPHGAYLRVTLKPKHWLTYGIDHGDGNRVPALFREEDVLLSVSDANQELIGRYAEPQDLMMSGLVWPEAVGYIAGTAYLARETLAQGQVISFANDPTFRGYSLGTSRLFLNAVILASGYE